MSKLSAKFANMSILCAFMVVCMHIGGEFESGSAGWWLSEFTRGGVSRVAVPYFFLASGFFLTGKFASIKTYDMFRIWIVEVVKRIKTLLVPLLLWPIIGMLWAAPFVIVANKLAGRPLGHTVPLLNGTYWPGVGILWFVKFLFILVLLSPILLLLVRNLGRVWLAIAFALYFAIYTFLDPVKATGPFGWCVYKFSLEGVAYFSAGMFLREFALDRLYIRKRTAQIFMVAGLIGVLFSITCNFAHIHGGGLNLRHYPIPFLMIGMFGLMPMKRWPNKVTTAAFPVYLMHGMWAMPITCILNRIPFIGGVAAYFIKWGVAFGMSVLTAHILRFYAPHIARILFGGRLG